MATFETSREGVDMVIEFYYQPYERQTLEYPGAEEAAEIEEVFVGGVNIIELLGSELLGSLEAEILNDIGEPDYD